MSGIIPSIFTNAREILWETRIGKDGKAVRKAVISASRFLNGNRWLRLASLRPETISYVDFYRNGKLYYTGYDEPFAVHFETNWRQGPVAVQADDREWKAVVHRADGRVIEKVVDVSGGS